MKYLVSLNYLVRVALIKKIRLPSRFKNSIYSLDIYCSILVIYFYFLCFFYLPLWCGSSI
jgi:hypothetical protein